MEKPSNVVIRGIGKRGHVLLLQIAARLKWADDGTTQTLEIPVTCHSLGADGRVIKEFGTNAVLHAELHAEEGTQFGVLIKLDELPKHIAAMVGASSSR